MTAQERDEIAFFNVALPAWHERGDLAPLLDYVRSDRAMTPRIREVVAALIEMHARTLPRGPGAPAGDHLRWQQPRFLAAYLAEHLLNRWREKHGKQRVPKKISNELIWKAIRRINRLHYMRDKEKLDPHVDGPDHVRIVRLLRDPKSTRL